jgi:predicted RNA binding protein YcfA (HicA-like mRNA interferase family)
VSRLPQVKPREMIAALERAGFAVARTKGSHYFLVHPDDRSRWATVAVHTNDMPPRDVRDILKAAKITRAAFLKLL